MISVNVQVITPGGEYSNYSWNGYAVRGLKPVHPTHIKRGIFLTKKKKKKRSDLTGFDIFCKSGHISKGFLPQKWLIL